MCCAVLGICRSIWNKFRFDCCGQCSTKTRASDLGQGLFCCITHQPTSEQDGTGREQQIKIYGGNHGRFYDRRYACDTAGPAGKYKDKWEPIGPEAGKHKLLWMLGEVGEVIDIIKKNGDQKAVEDAEVRQHLVEEMADVLMYYNDVLLCYGISEQELKEAYTAKFKKNMTRW